LGAWGLRDRGERILRALQRKDIAFANPTRTLYFPGLKEAVSTAAPVPHPLRASAGAK